MSPSRPKPVPPDAAADEGFPVEVDLRGAFVAADGPLVLTAHDGSEQHYTLEGGRTTASTRARLDALVALGGVALISPTGDAAGDPAGDTTS